MLENCICFNQFLIMAAKSEETVKVMVRIRPMNKSESERGKKNWLQMLDPYPPLLNLELRLRSSRKSRLAHEVYTP